MIRRQQAWSPPRLCGIASPSPPVMPGAQNPTSSALLLTRLLHQAATRPTHPAFIEGDRVTSFGALAALIAAQGEALKSSIQPGDRVSMVMDNCTELAVAIYATWWAGGGAGALNPALKPADTAPRTPQPEALASLVFTSGTTGKPKGVMLSHGALAANTLAVQQTLPMSPDDVTLCVLPFHYAFGSSVLHTHLSLGATLVLENSFMYPQRIVQRMAQVAATHFYGVPSSFYLLLERGQLSAQPLPALRHVAQAGGPMDPARIERFQAALPPGGVGGAWARGPNLMLGYWASPEDTASTLVDGWLHTGDIGPLDADGCLFLHGRSREILKVG